MLPNHTCSVCGREWDATRSHLCADRQLLADRHRQGLVTKTEAVALVAEVERLRDLFLADDAATLVADNERLWHHAEALYDSLNHEFDGSEAMAAYERFKASAGAAGEEG
jgi:hypothetical protein